MKLCNGAVLPVQIPPQGSSADAQLFCGGRLVSFAGIQDIVHDVPVHLIQGLTGIQAEWGGACMDRKRKSGKQYIFPLDYFLYGFCAYVGAVCPYDGLL